MIDVKSNETSDLSYKVKLNNAYLKNQIKLQEG